MLGTVHRVRGRLSLLRWLGPWTPATQTPDDVRRRTLNATINGKDVEAHYYLPLRKQIIGSMLVSHGAHFLGPTDPRFERFCRVLAEAGLAVMAPFMRTAMALTPRGEVVEDFTAGFELLCQQPDLPSGQRPGVFSISFGSYPALRLAADPRYTDQIGGLILFGGYTEWKKTVRYMIDGYVSPTQNDPQRNPLNRAVVFINLLDQMNEAPSDPKPLLAALERFVRETWPIPEMKELELRHPIVEQIALDLPMEMRQLFRQACVTAEGGEEIAIRALERADALAEELDPSRYLSGVRCPVTIVHGVNDDVIHHTQADVLASLLTNARPLQVLRTGLYSHAQADTTPSPSAIAKEVSVLLRTMNSMITAATDTMT